MVVVLRVFRAKGKGQKAEWLVVYYYLHYDSFPAGNDIAVVVEVADISNADGADRFYSFAGICKRFLYTIHNRYRLNYCFGGGSCFKFILPEMENCQHRIENVPRPG